MRSIFAIGGALAVGGCSGFDTPTFSSNKIFVSPASVVTIAPRESHRYACANPPMVCVQHGFSLECRCP